MKVIQHVSGIAGAALFAAFTLAGCGGGQSTDTNNGAGANTAGNTTAAAETAMPKIVTIGYNPTIAQPQPLLGFVKGEYAKRIPGVKFEFKAYKAGPAVIEALRSGVVDIGCSGVYPPLKAYAKDGDIVLLAGAAKGGTEIMVAKNSPIKTLKDLKGKVVGVNQLGSTVDTMVRYNLINAGLVPDKDVRIIPIEPAAQADELTRGDIAAVAAPAPWPSVVMVAGGRPLLDWRKILDNGNYLAGSFFTNKKFAESNSAFIKKFVEINGEMTNEINKDRAKNDAEILAAWTKVSNKKLPPAVAKAAFSTIEYTLDANPKDLQRFADIAFETGALKKKADLTNFVFDTK